MSANVTIRYDVRCYFNVRSKADISQLNLSHGTKNEKVEEKKVNSVVMLGSIGNLRP